MKKRMFLIVLSFLFMLCGCNKSINWEEVTDYIETDLLMNGGDIIDSVRIDIEENKEEDTIYVNVDYNELASRYYLMNKSQIVLDSEVIAKNSEKTLQTIKDMTNKQDLNIIYRFNIYYNNDKAEVYEINNGKVSYYMEYEKVRGVVDEDGNRNTPNINPLDIESDIKPSVEEQYKKFDSKCIISTSYNLEDNVFSITIHTTNFNMDSANKTTLAYQLAIYQTKLEKFYDAFLKTRDMFGMDFKVDIVVKSQYNGKSTEIFKIKNGKVTAVF